MPAVLFANKKRASRIAADALYLQYTTSSKILAQGNVLGTLVAYY